MLKEEQIVCIGFPKWEGEYMKSTVQLMSELAVHNTVLYVDYPYTWKDFWAAKKEGNKILSNRIWGKKPEGRLRTVKVSDTSKVYVLTLRPFFPNNWISNSSLYTAVNELNVSLNLPVIRSAMKKLQIKRPIVINAFNPSVGNRMVGRLEEKLLVYYCYDEIAAAPWIKKHGAREERKFLEMVDLVITSSDPLQEKKSKINPECYVVKNGVNYELFSQKVEHRKINPAGYKAVVGYLGTVGNRLDYQLLKAVAVANQDLFFAFVGRINSKVPEKIFSDLSNVRLYGPQAPAELAQWVHSFDVGVIPFLKNELTAAIYPLKINEYLAQGKPVITTSFADLSDFQSEIYIADTPTAFSSAIRAAIEQNNNDAINSRKAMAFNNSWPKRAEAFGSILHNYSKFAG